MCLTVCLLSLCASRVISQQSNKPVTQSSFINKRITRDNLISSLKLGERERKTAEWYIQLIKQHGVDFRLKPSDEQKIREAGKYLGQKGVTELLAAVRNSYKVLILVAEFQSLDKQESPAVTEMILNQLRAATRVYSDTRIEYLSAPITVQQGDDAARQTGKESGANFVIWGWYSRSRTNVYANVHFVFVNDLESWPLCVKSEEETFNLPLDNSESYSLQTKLTDHMTYLTLFATGLSRLDANDADAAIEKFNQALKLQDVPEQMVDPAQVYHSRARAFLLKNNYDLAIADYDKIVRLKPIAQSYISRGAAYRGKGEYDLALADLNQAISLDPRSTDAHHGRGVVYTMKGRYDLAIIDFSNAIALDSKYTDAYFGRGYAYKSQGNHDLALADFNQAISLDPSYVCAYYGRGATYEMMGNSDLAIDNYTHVITHHPDFSATYVIYAFRGQLYAKKGRYDLAIADFNNLVALHPEALAYSTRARAYAAMGKDDLAIADFSQAITLDPKDVDAYIDRGRLYGKKEKYNLAIDDFSQAILLNPKHAGAYFKRGVTYFVEGKIDLAIADLTNTITLDPDHMPAYFTRGLAHVESGNTIRAVLDFNKVLHSSSDPELRRRAEQKLKQITVK